MNYFEKLVTDIEIQSVDGIKSCFENGVNPNDSYRNEPLIYELINGYARGPKFKECVKAFVNYGLQFEDEILLSVLMDDAPKLESQLNQNKNAINHSYTLKCAFTPLFEVTLLHICAEFNHLSCAKVLIDFGADVNAMAGFDENGFGGQTPIFHTVNQNAENGIDVLNYLITQSVNLDITIKGLIWGKGYEWETFIPAINPISYSMMGLLRQFQRKEVDTYNIVSLLFNKMYNSDYTPTNIPNKYLL